MNLIVQCKRNNEENLPHKDEKCMKINVKRFTRTLYNNDIITELCIDVYVYYKKTDDRHAYSYKTKRSCISNFHNFVIYSCFPVNATNPNHTDYIILSLIRQQWRAYIILLHPH